MGFIILVLKGKCWVGLVVNIQAKPPHYFNLATASGATCSHWLIHVLPLTLPPLSPLPSTKDIIIAFALTYSLITKSALSDLVLLFCLKNIPISVIDLWKIETSRSSYKLQKWENGKSGNHLFLWPGVRQLAENCRQLGLATLPQERFFAQILWFQRKCK